MFTEKWQNSRETEQVDKIVSDLVRRSKLLKSHRTVRWSTFWKVRRVFATR